jgi:hypothetical protein
VLVLSSRESLKTALQTCRAIRPLTGAAIVFASDDAIRSTDRVSLLDAGADDCLSGGINVRELEARIERSVVTGGKPPSPVQLVAEPLGGLLGGRVDPLAFRRDVQLRKADSTLSVFLLVNLSCPGLPPSDLESILGDLVRDEEGDMVTRSSGGCMVLLQGARRESARAFLARLHQTLRDRFGRDQDLQVEVLAHPTDESLVDSAVDALSRSGAGGPVEQETGGSGGLTG